MPGEEPREFVRWRYEREAAVRGLDILKRLRKRALVDPGYAHEEASELLLTGEVEVDWEERDTAPSDEELVVGYYSRLIAAYELRAVDAQLQKNFWALSLAPQPVRALQRPRESRPRRRRVRSSPAASRDGPDDDEPHERGVGEPASDHDRGRLGVEAVA